MTRTLLLLTFLLTLFTAPTLAADRPNIIFIFTDDHASHAISAYGSKVNKTPHIDRIAKDGMRFDYCLVTNSICGPSRATILTGKYSHENGFYRNGNNFDGSQWTFPKSLQKAGYQTAMIGKWHLSSDPTGFDYWEVLYGQGPYYNPPMKKNGERVNYTGYTTEIITDRALDWLKNHRDGDKPFMMMYQHKAPHRNWQPGPDYLTMYDDVTIPEPDTLFDDWSGRGTASKQQAMTVAKHLNANDLKLNPPRNLTPEQLAKWNAAYEPKNQKYREMKAAGMSEKEDTKWKYQRYVKDYLRCVAAVDDQIGRLQKYLEETGLDKNTIVIYSSDQGWYLGDHGWYDKRWMYEESLKMPFVVKWPGVIKPGTVNKDLVSNVDFAATFLDIAGAENPGDLHGRSLVPLMKGKTPDDWRDSFYYHYYEFPGPHSVAKHYGVRTERYKLIHFYRLDEWELYDLKNDPDEMQSIYNDPDHADVVKRLKAKIVEHQNKLGEENPEQPVPGDPSARRGSKFKPGKLEQIYGLGDSVATLGGTETVNVKADKPDCSARPLAVGGFVNPAGEDGVVIAQGGESFGYALYLKAGVPHFAVRSNGDLATVKAKSKVAAGQFTHLAGVLDADKKLRLYVNGEEVASAKGHAIASQPADVLSVGADTGSLVADYGEKNHFKGVLKDVRAYVGPMKAKEIKAWAGK